MDKKQQHMERLIKQSNEMLSFLGENWVAVLIVCVVVFLMVKYAMKALDAKQERSNSNRIKKLMEELEKYSQELGKEP